MSQPMNVVIDDYSSPIDLVASEDMPLIEACKLIDEHKYRHLPVVRDGKPVGILSDRDLNLLISLPSLPELTVRDVMVQDPFCVYSGTSIDEVAYQMAKRKIGSALVLNKEGKLESIFTSLDGLNALIEVVRGDVEA